MTIRESNEDEYYERSRRMDMMSGVTSDRFNLAATIKQRARATGFDLCGIAPADPSRYADYFRQWLDAGRAGSMHYLHERVNERLDPSAFLPGARSVICVAMNYLVPIERGDRPDDLKIARYAIGKDYHEHVKPRLYEIADWIRASVPGAQTKCGVDTVPVLERELAARAGVGWIGKNTCVINERIGSWMFLGEVLTTIDLPFDEPAIDRCGTCTRCIDACPTRAIVEPYQLDASKCVSYLTIEHADEISDELKSKLSGWAYGCDICQDVCPWNRRAPEATLAELLPATLGGSIGRQEVLQWTEEDYWKATRRTAMRRVKLPQWKRNASLA
jgi:epoxyqueuosine reductase